MLQQKYKANIQAELKQRENIQKLLQNRYYNNNYDYGGAQEEGLTREEKHQRKLLRRFTMKDIILKDKDFYSRLVHCKDDRGSILKGINEGRLSPLKI
ncbi:hypothetical protein FGO68_gene13166 [Halteria grandinella]|uniref:Uncharacterized protein n=1 Tax=Halteria grandinella TaxID=5974 RepID=A0A8J8NP41_HALGN|nr:hypothetical protein FGO68_gene13166 [Halteria grandinella]